MPCVRAACLCFCLLPADRRIRTDGCWIGFQDTGREGGFVWLDGSTVEFVDFAPGEPNGVDANGGGEDAVELDFRPRQGGSGGWNDMHVEGVAGHSGGLGTSFTHSMGSDCFGCAGAYGGYPLCETVHPHDCTSTGGIALEGSPCQFPFEYQGQTWNTCAPMAQCVENTCHNDGHWVK